MLITLGAAMDAGTFVAMGPAAGKAGSGLPTAIVLAGLVALATATSGAQLGAAVPVSGGGFTWARAVSREKTSFLAGISFLGKEIVVQSVNALTLVTFAQIVVPALPLHVIGAAIIVANTALNAMGVAPTAKMIAWLTVMLALLLAGYCALVAPIVDPSNLQPLLGNGALGLLQGAGIIFFAFAGFERVAVIASVVRQPERTIPRAIFISFPISAALFLLIGSLTLGVLGVDTMSDEAMALPKAFAQAVGERWVWAVAVAAIFATVTTIAAGVLGDSQVAREMGRKGELPRWFGAVHGKNETPRNAVLVLGFGVAAVTLLFDVRPLIDVANVFSLVWYGAVNYACLRLDDARRFAWRGISWFGLIGCAVLLFTLSWWAILLAAAILMIAMVVRHFVHHKAPAQA